MSQAALFGHFAMQALSESAVRVFSEAGVRRLALLCALIVINACIVGAFTRDPRIVAVFVLVLVGLVAFHLPQFMRAKQIKKE